MKAKAFNINPKVKKILDSVFLKDSYALVGSPYNSPVDGLKESLFGGVDDYLDLNEVTNKQLKSKNIIHKASKVYIQMPLRTGLKKKFLNRRIKFILLELEKYGVPVIPMYVKKNNEQEEHMHTINTGGIVDIQKYLMHHDIDSLGMFLEAQFKALRINFDLEQPKGSLSTQDMEPVIPRVSSELLIEELSNLPTGNLVYEKYNYQVYICRSEDIPLVLREIGRVRELTFREVEEGTGRSFDLDNFDLHYLQLFIWDSKENKLVGGYRLGIGHEIIPTMGINGMYISKLFKIKKRLIPTLTESLEMGRSFVLPEYQKQRLPLYLLWRGILELLTIHTDIKYLYGPVSISKSYSNLSKDLIIEFIKANYYNPTLAKLLKPRKPYKFGHSKKAYKAILQGLNGQLTELDEFIENIEPTHMRLPVLIKQYIKQNARFIGFNLDPNFSDALDGFVILNLEELPVSTLSLLKNE